MRFVARWVAAVAIVAGTASASEVVPLGPEFRISRDGDTYTYSLDGYARDGRIAHEVDGTFIVVWDGYFEGPTRFGNAVFARRLDAPARPVGGESQLSPDSALGLQLRPGVAADPAGGFIAVWGDDGDVRAERFDGRSRASR